MIRISQAARRYGHVLYTLAVEQKAEDKILADWKTLAHLVMDHRELRLALRNPLITREDGQNIVNELVSLLKLDKITHTVLHLLATQRRLNQIKGIYGAYEAELQKTRSEMVAMVSSPYELSSAQIQRLSQILEAKTGHKVGVQTHIDKSLLGGLVIRLGSHMIDASIKTKMNKLKHNLERVA